MRSNDYEWQKNEEDDQIWWLDNYDVEGEWIFSFDRVKQYNLFRDYPDKLSPEEKAIFDMENPYWANFFKNRK